MGTWYVKPCNLSQVPTQLLALSPDATPQYLVINDIIFRQQPGSPFMNPYMANTGSWYNSATTNPNGTDTVTADHIFVNGVPW
jgi:hypothetical protein